MINALAVVGKKIGEVKIASTGAGAAGIACLDMLVQLGVKPENIFVVDRDGVLYNGRADDMDPAKQRYARDTDGAHAWPTSSRTRISSSACRPAAC